MRRRPAQQDAEFGESSAKSSSSRASLRWESSTIWLAFLAIAGTSFLTSQEAEFWTLAGLEADEVSVLLLAGACGEVFGYLALGLVADVADRSVRLLCTCNLGAVAIAVVATQLDVDSTVAWVATSATICGSWTALVRIIAAWVPPGRRGRVLGLVQAGTVLGAFVSRLLLAACVAAAFSWRITLLIGALFTVALTLPAAFLLHASPRRAGLPELVHTRTGAADDKPARPSLSSPLVALLDPRVLLLALFAFQIVAMQEFVLHFSPSFLAHVHCKAAAPSAGSAADFDACTTAAATSTAVEWALTASALVTALSVAAAGWCRDLLHPALRSAGVLAALLLAHAAALALWCAGDRLSLPAATALVVAAAVGTAVPFSVVVGAHALELAGASRPGTTSGVIAAAGSAGTAVYLTFAAGMHEEWGSLFGLLCAWSAGALATGGLVWRLEVARVRFVPGEPLAAGFA